VNSSNSNVLYKKFFLTKSICGTGETWILMGSLPTADDKYSALHLEEASPISIPLMITGFLNVYNVVRKWHSVHSCGSVITGTSIFFRCPILSTIGVLFEKPAFETTRP